jgi:hypothetical protein
MSFTLIDINDLDYWSGQTESKADLPLLISRLIRLTTPSLIKLLIPKGKSTYRGGWDGRVEISSTSEFVPEGLSFWEFGTEKNPASKAEKDYRKRTEETVADDYSNATFVFVTTRYWEKSSDWISQKKAEGIWKNIVVIDGNLLVEWLAASTIISQQLAVLSGVKIKGSLESIPQFWHNWSTGPQNRQFSPKILLAGRKPQASDLLERLFQPSSVIPIQASTIDETLAFCAAAIISSELNSELYISKSVIVENEEDFKLLLYEPPAILIPRFPVSSIIYTAIPKGHTVIVLLGAENSIEYENKITLPKIGREEVLEGLSDLGLNEDQARALSRETGRNISIIRRRLGFSGKLPDWASQSNYPDLLPALMAGKWDDHREGDRVIISQLSGMDYNVYTEKLRKWLVYNDAPIVNVGSHWRIISPLDAWTYLGQFLSGSKLSTLADAFLFACGDIKPSLSLEPDQRYLAAFYGKLSDFSHHIREGISQSLVLIALYGDSYQLQIPVTSQQWVDQVIGKLCGKQDQNLWKSLDDVLPLIAEASPCAFLDGLDNFLKKQPEELKCIFEEANGFISPSYYHTGMLWALESLAWLPYYFPRSCIALLKLNKLDPGVKIQNRPGNSIREILNPWMPQTYASATERKALIKAIAERDPDEAWDLCLALLPDNMMIGHPTSQLRWRQYQLDEPEMLTNEIYAEFLSFLSDLLINMVTNSAGRYVTLLNRFDHLMINDKRSIIDKLRTQAPSQGNESQEIWKAIREILHNQHLDYRENWFVPESDVKDLWELYRMFTPESNTIASLWVFNEHWPHFPEGFGNAKDNGTDQEEFIRKKRIETLKRLYKENDFGAFLDFVTMVKEPWIFGSTASMISLKLSEKVKFAQMCDSTESNRAAAARGFISQTHFSKGIKFSAALYEALKKQKPGEEKLVCYLFCCRSEFAVWELVERQSDIIKNDYWKNCEGNFWDKGIAHQEYQIEKLKSVKRYYTILHICSYNIENHKSEILLFVLEQIADAKVTDIEQLDPHHITRLMDELYKRGDADQTRLARLEWALLEVLTRGYGRNNPKTLYQAMSDSPSFFIDILCFLYQPDNDELLEKESKDADPEFLRLRAQKAYKLLDNWDIVPGTTNDQAGKIMLDPEKLRAWVCQARELAFDKYRLQKADLFIGKILAKYPEGDELWPPAPIASIIDEIDTERLKDNFRATTMNKRSSSSRSPFAGGQRERGLAAYFQRLADGHRLLYPVTSSLLANMAASWIKRGKEEDNDAMISDFD